MWFRTPSASLNHLNQHASGVVQRNTGWSCNLCNMPACEWIPKLLHPRSLTWTLKSNNFKRTFIFQPSFLGVYVKLQGWNDFYIPGLVRRFLQRRCPRISVFAVVVCVHLKPGQLQGWMMNYHFPEGWLLRLLSITLKQWTKWPAESHRRRTEHLLYI